MSDALWLQLISDIIIALAYFSIVFVLAYFLKRRTDLTFKSAFIIFGLFIMMGAHPCAEHREDLDTGILG